MTPDWDGGWWQAASRRSSPNFDQRADGASVELIVLHHISLPAGCFEGDAVECLFENRLEADRHPDFASLATLRISAHFFVRRDGEVMQFVSCDERAWHAGVSAWHGRAACNDFSVGIELEGDAEHAFTDPQYVALNRLLDALADRYPQASLSSHSEIAAGRKIDPGPCFDWSRLGRRWHV